MNKKLVLTSVLLTGIMCTSCSTLIALKPNKNFDPLNKDLLLKAEDTAASQASEEMIENTAKISESTPAVEDQTSESYDNTVQTNTAAVSNNDEVLVYPLADLDIIDTFDGSMHSVFSVTQADGNKKSGVIDVYGNTRLKAEYDYLGWCDWHEVLYGSKGWPDTIDYPVYIDEEYRLDNLCGHGGGAHWAYILDTKSGIMYSMSSSEGGVSIYEVSELPNYTPYLKYDAAHPLEFDYDYYRNLPYALDEYGYYDEMYDDIAYLKYDDYIYGLREKEFECEFKNDSNQTISLGKCSIWYSSFVNDYLKIGRNGKFGFVDKNGNDASQFVYEDAEEAYDGRAWVKLDGKWRVIKLR